MTDGAKSHWTEAGEGICLLEEGGIFNDVVTEGFTDKVVMGAGIEKVRVPERRKAKKESPEVSRGDCGEAQGG